MTEDFPPPDAIDIGDGHFILKVVDADGVWIGIDEIHKNAAGDWCGGWVPFSHANSRQPAWNVDSAEPLTLSPSLLCDCGSHGFIRAGRWIAA